MSSPFALVIKIAEHYAKKAKIQVVQERATKKIIGRATGLEFDVKNVDLKLNPDWESNIDFAPAVRVLRRHTIKVLQRFFRGVLGRQIIDSITDDQKGITINDPRSNVLDRGGVINARGKFMAIPIERGGPRIETRKGNLVSIVTKKKKILLGTIVNKQFRPEFVLKKSVKMKPTNFRNIILREAQRDLEAAIRPEVERELQKAIK